MQENFFNNLTTTPDQVAFVETENPEHQLEQEMKNQMVSAQKLINDQSAGMFSKSTSAEITTPEDVDNWNSNVTPEFRKPSKIQIKDLKNNEVVEIDPKQVPEYIKNTIEDQGAIELHQKQVSQIVQKTEDGQWKLKEFQSRLSDSEQKVLVEMSQCTGKSIDQILSDEVMS